MNYRHTYHAGNFADVLKHVVLIDLLQALTKKDTAFCYLETHAGIGSYDLLAATTQKQREYLNGIAKVLAAKKPPALIQDYINCVKKYNNPDKLRTYPGSPCIAQHFLRPQDRMILAELHKDDYQTLKDFFVCDKKIGVHCMDGYQGLKAFLPPKEKRGLVLIDPPYENPDELSLLPERLAQALRKWETGIYAVWYPIKARPSIVRFYREITAKITRPVLQIELCAYPDDNPAQLNGSGMLIVNPPWQMEQRLQEPLRWLWEVLSVNGQGMWCAC